MTSDLREAARIRTPLLIASAAAWLVLLAGSGDAAMASHEAAAHGGTVLASMHPSAWLAGWTREVLMLAAMMPPVLSAPVTHLRLHSFAYRRARAIALFVAGYAAIWIAAGGALVAVALTVVRLAPQAYLPAAGAALIALVWQCSPIKQRCLNRCHDRPDLSAFGAAAEIDALRFGATHGLWCAGSCWALMLVPMLVPSGHLAAMAAATIVVVCERFESPRPAAWRVRGLGKARRILVAQARIRLAGVAAR